MCEETLKENCVVAAWLATVLNTVWSILGIVGTITGAQFIALLTSTTVIFALLILFVFNINEIGKILQRKE